MLKLNSRPILFLLISVFTISFVTAQNKTTKKAKPSKGFEVQLPVVVTDKKRNFVANLTSEDFVVLENNRRQKIKRFSDRKTVPPL